MRPDACNLPVGVQPDPQATSEGAPTAPPTPTCQPQLLDVVLVARDLAAEGRSGAEQRQPWFQAVAE
jgi:hypothetical protein